MPGDADTDAGTGVTIGAAIGRDRLARRDPRIERRVRLQLAVDRDDVWYDLTRRWRKAERRPALTLFAIVDGARVPLVRWPTTIGGWQDEQEEDESVVDRWKESPVGPRVWRMLHVGPTWLPPDTTPDRELARKVGDDRYTIDRPVFGPSYRSAYGLVMLVHERVITRRGAVTYGGDQWVRTHGSGNVGSIFDGHSHGCHRLLPPLALRLAGFLVAHRAHVRNGEQATHYRRTVRWHGVHTIAIDTRGYQLELTPPVPVDVLPGRIRSRRKTPPPRHAPVADDAATTRTPPDVERPMQP